MPPNPSISGPQKVDPDRRGVRVKCNRIPNTVTWDLQFLYENPVNTDYFPIMRLEFCSGMSIGFYLCLASTPLVYLIRFSSSSPALYNALELLC